MFRSGHRLAPLAALLFAFALSACGGGGGGSAGPDVVASPGAGPTPTTETQSLRQLNIETEREATSAGGARVALTAIGAGDDPVQWQLGPGSPGALSSATGKSVHYIPPPAGALSAGTTVNIIASAGDASGTTVLVLSPGTTEQAGTPIAEPSVPRASTGQEDPAAPPPEPGIYLIAGNDFGAGWADGSASAARFDTPDGVVRDAQGNVYVADSGNTVIRRISPQGTVSTLAGLPGVPGHADGTGSAARFGRLSGMALGPDGNLYVVDHGNAVIRRVTPGGVVTTVAGTVGVGGSGEQMLNGNPASLAFGPDGRLYIAELWTIRRLEADGTLTTVAGRGTMPGFADGAAGEARFTDLNGIAIDGDGVIYVTDGGWTRVGRNTFAQSAAVRRIAPDGTVTTLAGTGTSGDDGSGAPITGYADGSGADARFSYPQGIVLGPDGNLFVADRGNQVIRRVTPAGQVTTVAGVPGAAGSADGGQGSAHFTSPAGLAAGAGGALIVTDSADHTVRSVGLDGTVTTLAGAAPRSGSQDGAGSTARFNGPWGITRGADGSLYVADTGNATIRRIAPDGSVTTLAGSAGQAGMVNGIGSAARFERPTDVALDAAGNVLVADFGNSVIRRIAPDRTVTTFAGRPDRSQYIEGPPGTASLLEPQAVAWGPDGNAYVADRSGDAVARVTPQGAIATLYGNQDSSEAPFGFGDPSLLLMPRDLTVDSAGNVFVIDSHSALRRIAPDGSLTTLAGVPFQVERRDGTGAQARFNTAQGLALDADGNLYVAEPYAIRRVSPQGEVVTVAGAPLGDSRLRSIHKPMGVVVTGPKTLAYTSGNGVFELRLP